jgi:predicted Zn-dependent protease
MAIRSTKPLFAVLLLASVAGIGAAGYRAQVLPDMNQHIDCAKASVAKGEYDLARAHTDIVLLNHDVKVYVDASRCDRDTQALCQEAVEGATGMWKSALKDEVNFVIAERESEADIVVKFEASVYSNSGQAVGGTVSWTRSVVSDTGEIRGVVKAQIKVRTYSPNGSRMTLEQMRHVSCHELGHVLGLGDSPRIGDIMGPLDLQHPATQLGTEEVQALTQIRETAAGLRREATEKVLIRIGKV